MHLEPKPVLVCLFAALILTAAPGPAQTLPPPPPGSAAGEREKAVELSPFVISESSETG